MSQHAAKLQQVQALLADKPEQARAMCQRIVQSAPKDPWAHSVMSSVFLRLGLTTQALHFAQRAHALAPREPALAIEHARLLGIENQPEKGVSLMRAVLAAHPTHTGASQTLAALLEQMERHAEAEQVCREGLTHAPGDEGLEAALAGSLLNLGRIEETVSLMEAAAQRHPHNTHLASGLALMMNYMPGRTPAQVYAAHRRYAELLESSDPFPPRNYLNSREPGKRLRVGIISPDLRQHSVAFFMEPWFEHADGASIEFFIYQTNRVADAVTARLRALVEAKRGRWQVMDNISDHALAEKVFADRVDVLVELSGHTHAHSLAAMHRRPAPVQATYLGYPNTTGLKTIDYRIVDSHTDPAGAEAFASEQLLRLDPCFLCYRPPASTIAPQSAVRNPQSPITFGSFNTPQKLNNEVIRVWARALREVPGSRLLLKGGHPDDHGLREGVLSRFAAAGAEVSRVEFLARTKSIEEHLALYRRVDVALDPFPYNGTTTTCEALFMGVPVVTLAGETHAGRVGVSLLRCIGEEGLIARDEDEYVRLASGAVGRGRAELRQKLLASPLCDGPGFARRMEAALRGAWAAWCGG
jgi:protein O-GlcNAc transferase